MPMAALHHTAEQRAVSVRKLSASRLRHYKGPRRMKPRLNAEKRERIELLAQEETILSSMLHDDAVRAQINAGMGRPREPMSVWTDSDHSHGETLLQPCELPAWKQLSERMKIFIGFDAAMEFGWCFSFSANICPDMVRRWSDEGSDFIGNIGQRLRRAMAARGIADMPFCYVVEARTKSGKTRNKPHIHGIAICDHVLDATRLKLALESAFVGKMEFRHRRKAAWVKPSYAKYGDPTGRFRWTSYITKNAQLYDARLGRRRVFMSHSYIQVARIAWGMHHRRNGPIIPP